MLLSLINVLWRDVKANTMRPCRSSYPQASRTATSPEIENFVGGLDPCHLDHALGEIESSSGVVKHDIRSWAARQSEVGVVSESHIASAPELVIVTSASIVVYLCDLIIRDLPDPLVDTVCREAPRGNCGTGAQGGADTRAKTADTGGKHREKAIEYCVESFAW